MVDLQMQWASILNALALSDETQMLADSGSPLLFSIFAVQRSPNSFLYN